MDEGGKSDVGPIVVLLYCFEELAVDRYIVVMNVHKEVDLVVFF